MQPDWFGGMLQAPQSLNRYAYVSNDPGNAVDPSGMVGSQWINCLLDNERNCVGGGGGGGGCTVGTWGDFTDASSSGCSGYGAWAQADAAALFGYRWYDMAGNFNPEAQAEGRYDSVLFSWGNYDPAFGRFDAAMSVYAYWSGGSLDVADLPAGSTPEDLMMADRWAGSFVLAMDGMESMGMGFGDGKQDTPVHIFSARNPFTGGARNYAAYLGCGSYMFGELAEEKESELRVALGSYALARKVGGFTGWAATTFVTVAGIDWGLHALQIRAQCSAFAYDGANAPW